MLDSMNLLSLMLSEGVDAEGAMNPDSDINPVEPLNDQDMKRFLNLVYC